MSKNKPERENDIIGEGKRSSFLFVLLVSGFAVCAVSIFVMVSSLYSDSVNLPSVKTAFAGIVLSVAVIAIALFLRERETRNLADMRKKKALENLAVGVVHDLNNILACFETYATFLSEDLDDGSKQHGFAMRILEANERARQLAAKIHENPEIYEEE